jgi:mannose-6-phosphate isomerase-like protein (cupin superfamily)
MPVSPRSRALGRAFVFSLSLLAAAPAVRAQPQAPSVQWFEADELGARPEGASAPFLQAESLGAELRRIPAGTGDAEATPAVDTLYHVLAGQGELTAGGETRPVGPGSVVYVSAGVTRRFAKVAQDLTVLLCTARHAGTTGGMQVGPPPVKQTPYWENSQRGNTRIFYWYGADSAGQVSIEHGQPLWRPAYDRFLTQPKGVRWRLGENFWTTLDTNMDLTIGGVDVPVGYYYLALENSPDAGLRLIALDPNEVRAQRFDSFDARKTKGGLLLPVKLRRAETPSDRLRFDLRLDQKMEDHATLHITFGPHLLEAEVILHPHQG